MDLDGPLRNKCCHLPKHIYIVSHKSSSGFGSKQILVLFLAEFHLIIVPHLRLSFSRFEVTDRTGSTWHSRCPASCQKLADRDSPN